MTTHVRTWTGARNARLTDMEHAGKRGKRCRVMGIQGSDHSPHVSGLALAGQHTDQVLAYLNQIAGVPTGAAVCHVTQVPFDQAAAHLRELIAAARAEGVDDWGLRAYDEEIRSIDAPRPLLAHTAKGWSASADEGGISLLDDADQFNLPAMITPHDQTNARAYEIARKAWPEVVAAKSFHDAGDVLRKHGAKLHYYCRMD